MAVEHSKFIDIVNTILLQVGLTTITDEAAFNALDGLERPHLQIIKFVDHADAKLMLRLTELFTSRRFETSTQANVKELQVNAMTDLEGIKYHSLRVNSSSERGRVLNFIPYDIYRNMNPDLSDLQSGAPRSWTYFDEPEADNGASTRQIVLYPVPDAVYQIEYSAKINHRPLRLAQDKILWPPTYEHVLVDFGRDALEQKMGTGDLSAYAQAALDNVRQWATSPIDKVKKVRMGVKVGSEVSWSRDNTGYAWDGY